MNNLKVSQQRSQEHILNLNLYDAKNNLSVQGVEREVDVPDAGFMCLDDFKIYTAGCGVEREVMEVKEPLQVSHKLIVGWRG